MNELHIFVNIFVYIFVYIFVIRCFAYRSEAITPRRTSKMVEENGNSNNGTTGSVEGHYEMKSNGVLASS